MRKRFIYHSKKSVKYLLLCFLIYISASCRKDTNYSWLNYDETYCADAWASSSNNEVLKQNVVDYLKGKGVTVYDSEIFVARDAEPSTTCSNKTGRVIKCKVKDRSVSDIKSYGFYQ